MALIWRCATQAAREAMRTRTSIEEILRATGTGWEIPEGFEPPEDMTAKELAAWLREVARPCAS